MAGSAAPSPLRIPFGRPWITADERAAVLKVLDGPTLTHGPETQAFEREFGAFLGGDGQCVAVSSGMAALHLAALHCGCGPGDEVIVPAQTHASTVHAVGWTGATPVYVDCDEASGNMAPDAIAAAITPRTRAIVVVHFLGVPCEMQAIAAIAARHRLMLVEDCALAVGARLNSTHVGLFGDVGCFSFFPAKHLTTGEGGMFVTRNPDLANSARCLRSFAVDRSQARADRPWDYDVVSLGLNYRMDELSAALGRAQLRRIGDILERRAANFLALHAALRDVPSVRVLGAGCDRLRSSHYSLSVVLDSATAARRDAISCALNAAGIGTSVYYPHPVPRLRYYRGANEWNPSTYPNATRISDASIALPVAPHVSRTEIDEIARAVRDILDEARG